VTLPILLRVNLTGPVPGATLTMGGAATQFGIEQGAAQRAAWPMASRLFETV
jgi:hypothetical protein